MQESVLRKEEDRTFFDEDRDQPIPPVDVVAYNELRSCADLYRMFATGKLEIQPDFQREVVWKKDEQARFIDSLVKQLPIPSMCFSLDFKTQKWKVIDGLQRMSTITAFLGSEDWKIGDVEDIQQLLRNTTNNELKNGNDEQRRVYASVEDISIPITVIRCSYDVPQHMRYLFTIFNRLNSGGVRLNNQEIRNCIYSGRFNNLLKAFDRHDKNWATVRRRIWGSMDRFRSVEVLLRALAFCAERNLYDGNLAGFLNNFMHGKMHIDDWELKALSEKMERMAANARVVLDALPGGKRSLTFVEGVLVGLLSNDSEIVGLDEVRRVGGYKSALQNSRLCQFICMGRVTRFLVLRQ
ncbi:DUF262 domain-containing protein [Methylocystis echinoides]|uniref:DUF262 domain-containing protein n=1 Tax=Methylocystis echinoides TaxID=29468 RepID=UPI002492AB36|nr:DUF262 domain-containing protein [Methylocystis echinoides]